jgi:ABC-2 type transport system permease protein
VLRYFRLYLGFLRFSFSRAAEFRMDYYFRVAMDIVYYAANLAFFRVLYLHSNSIGGWNEDQAMIFVAAFLLNDAIFMTLFSNNFWMLPEYINKGHLDYYLTRPVSSLFFLMFREFAANSFLNLIIAAGIFMWAVVRYPVHLGAGAVALYIVLLVAGTLIHAMLALLFILPVFWMQGGRGLSEAYYAIEVYIQRPHQIFAPWLRRVLVSVLPLALVVSYPTQMLFSNFTVARVSYFLLVLSGIYGILVFVWGRGLRAYASASS